MTLHIKQAKILNICNGVFVLLLKINIQNLQNVLNEILNFGP